MEIPATPSVYGGDQDAKRRFACDSCRRGKLRCEWENDVSCTRCTQRNVTCVKYVAPPKRREKKPKTYLSSLEARLQRMEAAMRQTTAIQTPVSRPNEELDHKSISDAMSSLHIRDDGTSIFLGASSGFSIISELGLRWIEERTGNFELRTTLDKMSNSLNQDITLAGSSWCRLEEKDRIALPSEDQALEMLNGYFNGTFNTLYPLFDEFQIRTQFAQSYPPDPTKDVIWYATLNLIFAASEIMEARKSVRMRSASLSSQSSAQQKSIRDFESSKWWPWFKNGASKFPELQMMDGSLMAVQALTLITFILQTLPFKYSPLVVATAALRLAQAVGLHRSLPYPRLSNTEYELRRNVFWTAFTIERQILASAGQPSIVHEDDIGIDLPHDAQGGPAAGHLRRMAQIGLIQGKIHSCLYSARSLTKSRLERLQNAGMLDHELNYWLDHIPPALRPGTPIDMSSPVEVFFMPTLIMHLSYYNALTMIHRAICQDASYQMADLDVKRLMEQSPSLNPRIFSAETICLNAARSMIGLVDACSASFEVNDLNMTRVIAYYPLSSSLTLFANIVRVPLHDQTREDLERIRISIFFLSTYFACKGSFPQSLLDRHFEFVVDLFKLLLKIAEDLVERSNEGGRTRGFPAQVTNPTTANSVPDIGNIPAYATTNVPLAAPTPYVRLEDHPPVHPTHQTSPSDLISTPHMIDIEGVQETTPLADNPHDYYLQDDAMLEAQVFTPYDGSWFFPLNDPISNDLYAFFPPDR